MKSCAANASAGASQPLGAAGHPDINLPKERWVPPGGCHPSGGYPVVLNGLPAEPYGFDRLGRPGSDAAAGLDRSPSCVAANDCPNAGFRIAQQILVCCLQCSHALSKDAALPKT